MKKLMTIVAAACAMSAFAETKDLEESCYTFEEPVLEAGQEVPIADVADLQDGLWIGMEGAESSVIKAYAAGETPVPSVGDLEPEAQYLHIETDGSVLSRAFTNPADWQGSEEGKPGTGTPDTVDFGAAYIDAAVKFTATDTDPQIEDGAQFALWLKAVDGNEEVPGYTNLMVTCGSIDDWGNVTPVNAALNIDIEPDSWHRVTIKPVVEDSDLWYPGLGGFLIYIDGKIVAAKDYSVVLTNPLTDYNFEKVLAYAEKGQFFPSLLKYDLFPAQLTSVGFSGTGDIDMLNITMDDPIPPPPEGNFVVTWDSAEHIAAVNAVANDEAITSPAELPSGTEVIFTAIPDDGYEYATAPEGWELQEDGSITKIVTVVDEDIEVVIPEPTKKQDESWDIPAEDNDKPAHEVWKTIPQELANVPAGLLATWAKANGIEFGGEFTDVMIDAYLLDCAPEEVEEKAAEFKIVSIELIGDEWVVMVTGGVADGEKYKNNAKVVVEEITLPGAATQTSKFWQAKLALILAE